MWRGLPEKGGPKDDETFEALQKIFDDADLLASAEATGGPLGTAVRNICAILDRKYVSPMSSSRQIINALWEESALDRPWLYRALGKRNDRLQFRRGRPRRDDAS